VFWQLAPQGRVNVNIKFDYEQDFRRT